MTDRKRRYTDHLKQSPDHELLIKLHAKLDMLCQNIQDLKNTLKENKKDVDDRCDRRYTILSNSGYDRSTLLKFLGTIITLFVLMFGMAGFNRLEMAGNKRQLEEFDKKLLTTRLEVEGLKKFLPRSQ